jgi:hypothetical protein
VNPHEPNLNYAAGQVIRAAREATDPLALEVRELRHRVRQARLEAESRHGYPISLHDDPRRSAARELQAMLLLAAEDARASNRPVSTELIEKIGSMRTYD